jgi:hypothetical protein
MNCSATSPPSSSRRRAAAWLLGLAAVVGCSRIAFLDRAYALDADAWGIAAAARHLATTGDYVMSRPPGYPVPEIVYALFWAGGPAIMNGVTACWSVLGALSFALLLRRLGDSPRVAALGALAFAFVPLVYQSSTTSMDYAWGLALVTAALGAAVAGRPAVAGILAGIAVGCRLPHALMVVPLALILFGCGRGDQPARRVGLFLLVAAIAALVVYAPVYLTYGTAFLSFSDMPLAPPMRRALLLRGPTLAVWGAVGCAGLAAGLLAVACAPRAAARRLASFGRAGSWLLGACLVAILLTVAVFARLPHEYEYLLPIVPFTLLTAHLLLGTRMRVIVYGALLVAPFAFGLQEDGRIGMEGPMPRFDRLRKAQVDTIRAAFASVNRMPQDRVAVVVNHTYRAYLEDYPPACPDLQFRPHVELLDVLSPRHVAERVARGEGVYVLYGADWYLRQGCEVRQDAAGAWHLEVADFEAPDAARWRMTPFDRAVMEARLLPDADAPERLRRRLWETTFHVPMYDARHSPSGVPQPVIAHYDGQPSIAAFDTPERLAAFPQQGDYTALVRGDDLLQGVNPSLWLVINPRSLHPAAFGTGTGQESPP